MKGQPILKLLKQRLWILLPLLGLLAFGSVLLVSSKPAPLVAITTSMPPLAPLIASKPLASKLPPASPTATSSQAAQPSPQVEPALTPEQKALNQQGKAAFEAALASVDSLIEMRVAIAKGSSVLTVSVSTAADLIDEAGQHLGTLFPGETYKAEASGKAVRLAGLDLPTLVWIEPSTAGSFTLGDRTYRGRLLLAASDSQLWGVNFVSLRQYLYSVVASEVSPGWHMEALKAQAVAARSYALTYYFKPVNSLYQLGDDEYFQVYSGTAREAETTSQAVDATAGEFVSYRGGVVESLYAASDDIVAHAFQGKGMSQLGALGLAEQGYTYQQILSNYYPGTGVGRIQQDYE